MPPRRPLLRPNGASPEFANNIRPSVTSCSRRRSRLTKVGATPRRLSGTTGPTRQASPSGVQVSQQHRGTGSSRGETQGEADVRLQIVLGGPVTIAGIEVMHAIRKGQLGITRTVSQTPVEQFYALAAEVTESDNFTRPHLKFATKPVQAPRTGAMVPRRLWSECAALSPASASGFRTRISSEAGEKIPNLAGDHGPGPGRLKG